MWSRNYIGDKPRSPHYFMLAMDNNDRAEQNIFVRSQILAADDLVIYVLDTRKLMTLAEREHLHDWLEQRGMKTVVFVANFMNMLEPEECQHVQQRLRFVAESFRSEIPAGISNLYQVDALPALGKVER